MSKIIGTYAEKESITVVKQVRYEDGVVDVILRDGKPIRAMLKYGSWKKRSDTAEHQNMEEFVLTGNKLALAVDIDDSMMRMIEAVNHVMK